MSHHNQQSSSTSQKHQAVAAAGFLHHRQSNFSTGNVLMSPSPLSPVSKALPPNSRTSSMDSVSGEPRKRVCKACDRCRLKKSKCDGSQPCTRCKADNAICVFGERKKSHDKVYPKGYVEMLEQQQSQLVSGLQEMYRRALLGRDWETPPLQEVNGQPLTHDILAALGLLVSNDSGEPDIFEEDTKKLQSRFAGETSGIPTRRGSFGSESDHSQGAQELRPEPLAALSQPQGVGHGFNFQSAPVSPTHVPAPRQRQSFPPAQQTQPIYNDSSSMDSDPTWYQAEWAEPLRSPNGQSQRTGQQMMRSGFAMQAPQLQNDFAPYNHGYNSLQGTNSNQWQHQQHNNFSDVSGMAMDDWQTENNLPGALGYMNNRMDFDFADLVQVNN